MVLKYNILPNNEIITIYNIIRYIKDLTSNYIIWYTYIRNRKKKDKLCL